MVILWNVNSRISRTINQILLREFVVRSLIFNFKQLQTLYSMHCFIYQFFNINSNIISLFLFCFHDYLLTWNAAIQVIKPQIRLRRHNMIRADFPLFSCIVLSVFFLLLFSLGKWHMKPKFTIQIGFMHIAFSMLWELKCLLK